MNSNLWIWWLFIVILLGGALGILFQRTAKLRASEKAQFKAKHLLTSNELEFIRRLESALPEYRVCPQVAMGALLDPNLSKKEDPKTFYRLRGMFSQKIVDFVIQDRATGQVIAIVELDDRTHESDKDAKRDRMLIDAGYAVIRWPSKNKPSVELIREQVLLKVMPNA